MAPYKSFRLSEPKINPIIHQLQLTYYRYKVTFGLYVMTSAEIFLVNTLVLLCLALLCYTLLYYMPYTLARLARRTAFYYWGPSPTETVVSAVRTILRTTSGYTAAMTGLNANTTRLAL